MRGAIGSAVLSVTAALASGAPAPASAAGSSYPNIVFILVDDLGESGVAFNNPHVLGPRVRELREEGLLLSRHYVYKYCFPPRGSMLTGRYPWRLGSKRSNFIPWSRPDGLRPDFFDLLPQRLPGSTRRVERRRRPRRRRADRRHGRRDGLLRGHRELRRHAPRRGEQLRLQRLRGEPRRRRQRVRPAGVPLYSGIVLFIQSDHLELLTCVSVSVSGRYTHATRCALCRHSPAKGSFGSASPAGAGAAAVARPRGIEAGGGTS